MVPEYIGDVYVTMLRLLPLSYKELEEGVYCLRIQ